MTVTGHLLGADASAKNLLSTTTNKITFGGGAIDMSAAGSLTTVKGTLAVTQTVTLTSTCKASGFLVGANQVVGARAAAVADATASIAANGGISGTYVQAEVEALRDAVAELQGQVNSLLAKLRTHGLIA